jgi:mannose-6-phosphate isomerase-like protein (cupin superfamily)
MARKLVFKVQEVQAFEPEAGRGSFVSRLLVDPTGVGAQSLVMNMFTLRSGKTTGPGGSHPAPFDEVYYVLRGRGLLHLGQPVETFEVGPDSVAFIPGGTVHWIDNTGDADLDLLTIMPGPMREGVNSVYDGRQKEWGTGFRLAGAGDATGGEK